MIYQVVWLSTAKKVMKKIWIRTKDKEAVKSAAFKLERRLRKSGPKVGESRANHIRVALERPLGIHFFVSEKEKKVYVGHVWEYR